MDVYGRKKTFLDRNTLRAQQCAVYLNGMSSAWRAAPYPKN